MTDIKGNIFDIQRFSVNDGPGIRTTIFMKGCTIECTWCHNPESWDPNPELGFIEQKCILCQSCAQVCDFDVHEIKDDSHSIERLNCTLCGQCVEVCPNNALKIYGEEYSVDEIFNIVIKDKEYYRQSGGGVTVSGGEPLQQYRFVIELFQKLKEEDIHTCLDTSGFANLSIMEHIIPWTDLFLFDYKLSKEEHYCKHTNMNLETINQSLKILLQYSKQIILRCPIIPGINDNEFHFDSIRSIVMRFPNIIQVDIIPYHKLGEKKHTHLGNKKLLGFTKSFNFEKVELMQRKLENQLRIPIVLSKDYAH